MGAAELCAASAEPTAQPARAALPSESLARKAAYKLGAIRSSFLRGSGLTRRGLFPHVFGVVVQLLYTVGFQRDRFAIDFNINCRKPCIGG